MFPQKVLSIIAEQGMRIRVDELTAGLDSLENKRISAHLVNQKLRNKFLANDTPINPNSEIWGASFSLKDKALVERISEALLEAAKDSLPDNLNWYNMKKDRDEDISLSELITNWRNGSRYVKREIGLTLAKTFHPTYHANGSKVDFSSGADSYNQPYSRVLPKLYGKWDIALGADNKPNCLGKFQLLIALGNLFGVEMLTITPLVSAGRTALKYRAEAAKMIYDLFDKIQISISEKRKKSISNVFEQLRINQSLPLLQHFAVCYRLEDSCWLVIDPNSGMSSLFENAQDLEHAYKGLIKVKDQAPGASILLRDRKDEELYLKKLKETKKACDLVETYAEEISKTRNWSNLKQLMFSIGIASEILTWSDYLDISMKDKSKRFDTICLSLYRQIKPEFEGSITETDFEVLKESLIFRYLIQAEKNMFAHFKDKRGLGHIKHPAYEVSLAEFRMATATISHVAVDLSDEIGCNTEQMLYKFGIVEGHLHNAALGCRGFPSKDSKIALQLLKLQVSNAQKNY